MPNIIPGGCKKAEISFDSGTTKLDLGAPKKQGTSIDPSATSTPLADGSSLSNGVNVKVTIALYDIVDATKTAIEAAQKLGTAAWLIFTTFNGKTITVKGVRITYSQKPNVGDAGGESLSYMIEGSVYGELQSDVMVIAAAV